MYITGRRKDVLDKAAEEINADLGSAGGAGQVVSIQGDVGSKSGCVAITQALQGQEKQVCGTRSVGREKRRALTLSDRSMCWSTVLECRNPSVCQ